MKTFIRKKLPFIMIILQVIMILGILLYIVPGRYRLYDIVLYDASESVPANPLIGYAPSALETEACENTDLVFIEVRFSEWEPQEGIFDTASLEEKFHIAEYKEKNKLAVLRFVCDVPGEEGHMDIPDWLYRKTNDGQSYQDASGAGYAPNYANEDFIKAHKAALEALSSWCRQDSFVAYVEMGSVGHNGDWNAWAGVSPELVPGETVLEQYAAQYSQAFPRDGEIRVLSSGSEELTKNSGSWRDFLGDHTQVSDWCRETVAVHSSYDQEAPAAAGGTGAESKAADSLNKADQTDEENNDLWKTAPVGGGMTDSISMGELLMEKLSDTLKQSRSSHISFIGPNCPDRDQQTTNGSEMILRNVGYCIYLSRLQNTVDYIDDELLFHFTFANIGVAPLYWDWPVRMYVYDKGGSCIKEQILDLKLSELLPGKEITTIGRVPYSRELLKGYSIGIAITSPDGTKHITLAQKGVIPNQNGVHRIYKKVRY